VNLLVLLALLIFVAGIAYSVPPTHRTPVLGALAAVLGAVATVLSVVAR
jgi:hypothetical protein